MRRINSQALVGLVTLLLLAGLCVVVFSGTAHNLLQPGGTTVRAVFSNTAMMAKGSPVRVNGVQVGTVTGSQLDPGARSATVTMTISDRSVLPLYRDATSTLKWRTVLGANYAIDLTRGTSNAGPLTSETIPLAHTTGQVEVDQILDLLRDAQRQGIRSTLTQLLRTFSNEHAPGAALNALSQASPGLAAGLGDLQGEQSGDLHSLVENVAQTIHALDAPNQAVEHLIEGGATTLQATAAERPAIESTLNLSAGTLPQVQSTLADLNDTLTTADPLIARLTSDAPTVAPAVRALRPTVTTANDFLQRARPLLTSLRPTAHALRDAAVQGLPLVKNLTPSLTRVASQILPDLALVYKESGRATYEMIGPTIADLDAAAAALDGDGHFVTLTAGGGANILDTLPCRTYFNDPTATELATCESLGSYLGALLGGGNKGQLLRKAGR